MLGRDVGGADVGGAVVGHCVVKLRFVMQLIELRQVLQKNLARMFG